DGARGVADNLALGLPADKRRRRRQTAGTQRDQFAEIGLRVLAASGELEPGPRAIGLKALVVLEVAGCELGVAGQVGGRLLRRDPEELDEIAAVDRALPVQTKVDEFE